jgi:hypothetical protein
MFRFSRPLRDSVFFQLVPALKCRAIFGCSFGAGKFFSQMWLAQNSV